ncbi:hypothetical protein B0T25DRAFT_49396 [Lasiosphaeria hispida]|uniref:Uncharacterized protein n=1 Tax=Lasiosphaeria hispida TaxID=260671 RepID=A0AAJ0MKI7_9PEZI|nr:hypothetical protein B0T25DRAFT_49396 [Lasiosphaeria hispida]
MSGYANGGDSNWNETATHTGTWLGGNPGPYYMSAPEIAVIIVTIGLFMVAMFCVFYCRKLQMRRDTDMKNQARGRLFTVEGQAIEMKDNTSTTAANPDIQSRASDVDLISKTQSAQSEAFPADLESGQGKMQPDKRPLWHYIRWKDPNNTPTPRVKPRHVTEDDQFIPPNPYYGKG